MKTVMERILSRVQVDPDTGCWEWQGGVNGHGYGSIGIDGRKGCGVHRVMYINTHGPISSDQYVCHTCDNRKCCNPEHLWLGDNAANLDDMRGKGRSRGYEATPGRQRGAANCRAKLTEDAVREIRAMRPTATLIALAERYGVTDGAISDVVSRRRWAHVA